MVGRRIVEVVLEVEGHRIAVVALVEPLQVPVDQVFQELAAYLQVAYLPVACHEHLQGEQQHCHLVAQSA